MKNLSMVATYHMLVWSLYLLWVKRARLISEIENIFVLCFYSFVTLLLWFLSISNGIICFSVKKLLGFFYKMKDNTVNCMKKQALLSCDCCVESFLTTTQKSINWSSYIVSNINFMELMGWSKTHTIFIKLDNSNVLQHSQHKYDLRNEEVFQRA